MSSRFRNLWFPCSRVRNPVLFLIGFIFLAACSRQAPPATQAIATAPVIPRPAGVLRVCADPNNLPFSNQRGEGFENKIAELLAHDMGDRVEHTRWAQRRVLSRNALRGGVCCLVMGVASGFEVAARTRPYYRSASVFLTRKDRHLKLA